MKVVYYLFCCVFSAASAWQPKISIITSVYKSADFIEQFLDDITKQTVFDQCELILINANSPHAVVEEAVIARYVERFPEQVISKRLQQDPGIYGVWNRAISMARGEYITNANTDDRFAHDCYEQYMKALDQWTDIDLVYSDNYLATTPNETFSMYESRLLPKQRCVWARPHFSQEAIKRHCLPSSNPMWRKSMHAKYGYFDESFVVAGDWEMWIRAVAQGAQFKKMVGVYGLHYKNMSGLSFGNAGLRKQENKKIRKIHKKFYRRGSS